MFRFRIFTVKRVLEGLGFLQNGRSRLRLWAHNARRQVGEPLKWAFPNIGVPYYFGVLIIRILLFRVLY